MNRIRSIDLARGFTVLFIPAIHAGMLYSRYSVHDTTLGHFLIAIAEGPGGQLLMLLMGFSFTLKATHSTRTVCIKAVSLIALGYLLNILKFVLPYCFDLLPAGVLQDLEVSYGHAAAWQMAGIGDILHFAGIAFLVIHVVYKTKHYHIWALIVATLVITLSTYVWDITSNQPVFNYLLQLATGRPPQVFFPLFPWLAYPLAGLCIGYYNKLGFDKNMAGWGIAGAGFIVVGLLSDYYFPTNNSDGFYRTYPFTTVWHLGIVLVTLYGWHWIDTHCKDNRFFRLLVYSSKNITSLYLIQWIMICWMLPIYGYKELGLTISVLVMIMMTINTYLITLALQNIKDYYGHK